MFILPVIFICITSICVLRIPAVYITCSHGTTGLIKTWPWWNRENTVKLYDTLSFASASPKIGYDWHKYLQLLCREVIGFFFRGFPVPILPTKNHKPSEGCFEDKIGQGNLRWRKIFNRKSLEANCMDMSSWPVPANSTNPRIEKGQLQQMSDD